MENKNDNNALSIAHATHIERCKNDWKYFVDNFCFIYDPEANDPEKQEIPFLLWDFQEKGGDEIVNAIHGCYDLPIEKCRNLGLSWLVCIIFIHGWLFFKHKYLIGSRVENCVDRVGDMDALFPKLRYAIERLPHFIFPFKDFKNSKDYNKRMVITHPETGASITGAANSPKFGRSGRSRAVLLDEFSAWEQTDKAAYTTLSRTSKCRIPLSTPDERGTNCYYYKIVSIAKKKKHPVLTLPFYLRPSFGQGLRDSTPEDLAYPVSTVTSPWLEGEIEREPDIKAVAQEVLINYEASMAGKVFSSFSDKDQVRDDVFYNPHLPLFIAWDFGLDSTSLIWAQMDSRSGACYIIDEYENTGDTKEGSDIEHYADIVLQKEFDLMYRQALHFGDPNSGKNRQLAARGLSNAAILKQRGLRFKWLKPSKPLRIRAGQNLVKSLRVSRKCSMFIEMMLKWQFVKARTGNAVVTPKHDEHSHVGDAYTYLAVGVKLGITGRMKEYTTKYEQNSSGIML